MIRRTVFTRQGRERYADAPEASALLGEDMSPESVDEPKPQSRRISEWLLMAGALVALVLPIVLASTLPYSDSDRAFTNAILMGAIGGVLATVLAASFHSRRLRARGSEMSIGLIVIWFIVGIGLVFILGYITASIWFGRGPTICFYYC